MAIQMSCPPARNLSSGEAVCPACGRIWDPEDGRPGCKGPDSPSANMREVVARRELAKIRAVLSEEVEERP